MTELHRRTFLKGLGTAMALPLLDAMLPGMLRSTRHALAAAETIGAAPKRLAFLYIPNGVNIADWTPKGEGTDYTLSPILEPLASLRGEFSVLTGLTHNNARALGDGPGDHARSAACFLTGAHPFKTAGTDIRVGVSVDQLAAEQLGKETRFPSLEIGCESGRQSGGCDSGYSCAYSSNISWSTPQTPVVKETNPRLLFERLFMMGSDGESAEARAVRMKRRKSILDYVRDDASRLGKRLGATDRRKLDEYFEGVRQIERRLERVDSESQNPEDIADMPRPEGQPRDYREHLRLLGDLMVLAFRLDLTRVVSFMFANEGSNRSFPHLEIPEGHHHLSHHKGDRSKVDKIKSINRFQSQELAYILTRLREEREGDGTLLDSCMIVYGSAIADGNLHNHDNLPVLLAGGGGGSLSPGRHVRYAGETPLCNLYVSLLERVGVSVARFGDSSGGFQGSSRLHA